MRASRYRPDYALKRSRLNYARLIYALPLLAVMTAYWSCAPSQPVNPATERSQALQQVVEAQQYAAEIARAAGEAHARHEIGDAALTALNASGMALDAAWRAVAGDLANDVSMVQLETDLAAVRESRRALEIAWRTYGPPQD